jgi:alpha-tubulin suppressor-like RCC1 family protein
VVGQKTEGTLWVCGLNLSGQLGLGNSTAVSTFTQNTTVTGWESVKSNFRHTIMRREDNTIWGFGTGTSGRLATGTDFGLGSPTQLPQLTTGEWLQATPGAFSSLFKKNDGSIWVVGQNLANFGLGFTPGIVLSLTQSGTATDWLSVEAVGTHSMVLKNNGSLWTCGLNNSGQLGQGNTTIAPFWTQVGTATNWAKVRCGVQHTLALTNNGTLWAWGLNSSGQLGDGTTTNRSSPVQIGVPCTLNLPTFEKKVMQLWSNPVQELAQLSFTYDGVKYLTIINSQGQKILSKTVTDDFVSINTATFAKGVYFIQCTSEMGNEVLKMVKN